MSFITSLEPKLDADDLAHKDQAAKGVADTAEKVENIAATARQVAAEETLEARSLAQTANLSCWRQRRRSKAWKKTVGFSCRAHGTGWPSFWEEIAEGRIARHSDTSHGMVCTEAFCAIRSKTKVMQGAAFAKQQKVNDDE